MKNWNQSDLLCTKTSKPHCDSTDRSSEGQEHLPVAQSVFVWPKIHSTKSAVVLLRAVVIEIILFSVDTGLVESRVLG